MDKKTVVLLVDDEEMIRRVFSKILVREKFIVLCASNGKEALELLKQYSGNIDLVFLDIQMPVMGGRQALIEMKKTSSDVKIIMWSGRATKEEIAKLLELGATQFLQKPIEPKTFLKAIDRALDS